MTCLCGAEISVSKARALGTGIPRHLQRHDGRESTDKVIKIHCAACDDNGHDRTKAGNFIFAIALVSSKLYNSFKVTINPPDSPTQQTHLPLPSQRLIR